MNAVALAAVAALVTSTIVLIGLTGIARIPPEGYAGLGLLLTGFAATAWGREAELAKPETATTAARPTATETEPTHDATTDGSAT